jgi:hypothetical protein
MKRVVLPISIVALMLIALSAFGASSKTNHDFPTQFPPKEVMQKNFVLLKHDLSPLSEYHFKMLIAKGWNTIGVKIKSAPKEDIITDVALFQKRDKSNNPEADIAVYVVKIPGLNKPPAQWLESWVGRTFREKSPAIIQKKDLTSAAGQQVADILFTYKYEGEIFVSRIYSFLSKGEMFIIQGTAPEKTYNKFALNFFAAIATFDPFNRYK